MPSSKREASNNKSQSDKFKEAARELECDEDEKAWEERLRKVASSAPSTSQEQKGRS